ncbi:helix-turn-helix domain-containing protein [Streptomyces sp. NPDC002644]
MSTSLRFGPELRRLRQNAGLTLTEFSTAHNYDKGPLSKVERGERSASPELASRCDAFLGANGELQRLAVRPETDSDTAGHPAATSPWLVGRRAVLSAGTGALIDLGLTLSGPAPFTANPLLSSFRAQFDQLRKLGQSTAPKVLLPLLETQTRTVAGLAAGTRSVTRPPALLLGQVELRQPLRVVDHVPPYDALPAVCRAPQGGAVAVLAVRVSRELPQRCAHRFPPRVDRRAQTDGSDLPASGSWSKAPACCQRRDWSRPCVDGSHVRAKVGESTPVRRRSTGGRRATNTT